MSVETHIPDIDNLTHAEADEVTLDDQPDTRAARVIARNAEDEHLTNAEQKRRIRLMKTATHIANRALNGEARFSANYTVLKFKQPKNELDWRFVQERLAGDGIFVDLVDVVDPSENAVHQNGYSRKVAEVTSIPPDYSPKHAR
jgi:hypothetical protein